MFYIFGVLITLGIEIKRELKDIDWSCNSYNGKDFELCL